ncbi:MAG: diiron oxygenase [Sulfurifustis sp.]
MYTTATGNANFERKVVDKLAQSWDRRVAVRQERLDLSQHYDPTIPDFPIAMIPFWEDAEFVERVNAVGERGKLRFLAATWIAYNERVMYTEDEIVQPLCRLLLKDRLPGLGDPQLKQILAQAQVDEQFHILMCVDVCNAARARHQLYDYVLPEPLLGRRLKSELGATSDPREQALIRMAYATVSETTIHAYLKQLSSDLTIQPLNRIHTDTHRRDEAAHSTVFLEIARSVYKALDSDGKAGFREHMATALNNSVAIDVTFWSSTLSYLEARDWSSLIRRIEKASQSKRIGRDYTALVSLLDELNIKDKINFTFE